MQYSRTSPLIRRLTTRLSHSATQSVRHISQVRNLHIQAPAALYTVGSEHLRSSNTFQKSIFANQIRTYADKVVKVPQMAESISEGTLKQWVKQVGDFVQQDEEVATIETDKIDVTVNSPASGTIVEVYAQEEDNVSVGADFFKLELGDAPKEGAAPPKPKEEPKQEESKPVEEKKEEPKKEEQSKPEKPSTPAAAPKPSSSSPSSPASSETEKVYGSRNETRVKMNRMRLRIAERLKQSQDTAASLTTFNEIDMTNLMNLRSEYKDAVVKKHGVKFGFMSAFVKAAAEALKEIPAVNASIDGTDIVYHDFVDMSVAVSTPKGLVTPVLRNVEDMGFIDIEKNIAELGKKARDNKITIEDMAGGTFTISNGGVFGSLMGTPIINLPQTAILGMHAIKERPIAINGKVEIRPMMYVALTYDHRLVDGREAVTFLVRIKELVEDPRRLLLGV
ncbi:dihydrolipoyllysine-residue succinyltransferase E2 component [Mycotypha africana]|uniref:dihydrolipoyllysine-residue succinyltransferase E2 component n=1 Tax=Mycotypha africana TaxID=64632 RepID=UPI0023005C07|nr:dihydrolipoyllysine-residue succinyltransferase E2 component [Mycotypha africana]KAI8968351.1 dihydrolipoyllysine-residue succinyltransferase E2 component [Mycotypha africana]